jgi:hypothetical protein
MHRSHLSAQERALRSRLAQLVHTEPLLRATLSVREVTCGKPGCRCARGEKHLTLYVVSSQDGQSRQLFVPRNREGCVRQWVENYHKVRDLLEQISELFWERVKARKP